MAEISYSATYSNGVVRYHCDVQGCRERRRVRVADWQKLDAATQAKLTAAHIEMDAHVATHRDYAEPGGQTRR